MPKSASALSIAMPIEVRFANRSAFFYRLGEPYPHSFMLGAELQ